MKDCLGSGVQLERGPKPGEYGHRGGVLHSYEIEDNGVITTIRLYAGVMKTKYDKNYKVVPGGKISKLIKPVMISGPRAAVRAVLESMLSEIAQ